MPLKTVMPRNDYQLLESALHGLGIERHPAEIHGMLVGHLCAAGTSTKAQRATLYGDWLGDGVPASLVQLLEGAHEAALEALDEFSDFDFRLMTPGDDEKISRRAEALASWCSGFIFGFGGAGQVSGDALTGEVSEALQDLSRISALSEEVPEGEENEADLMEIEEFVRASTLLIFAETARPGRRR